MDMDFHTIKLHRHFLFLDDVLNGYSFALTVSLLGTLSKYRAAVAIIDQKLFLLPVSRSPGRVRYQTRGEAEKNARL